jgi:hypothetical protein
MEKQILTPDGVDHVVDWLYALDDEPLEAEAIVMESDIVSWILEHFITTPAQEAFLNSFSEAFRADLGGQAARTVRRRWPLTFEAAAPNHSLRSAKWIRSKEENEAGEGGPPTRAVSSGSLHIKTGY